MTETEVGWTAGILDGEGSVSLDRRGKKWRYPTLSVSSTDHEIVAELRKLLGGSITKAKEKRRVLHPHYKQCWRWGLNGSNMVLSVLAQTVDFLRCPQKKARATLILKKYRDCTPSNGVYDKATISKKEKFEAEFYEL